VTTSPRARDVGVAIVLTAAVILVSAALMLMHGPRDDRQAAPDGASESTCAPDVRAPIDTGMNDPWAIAAGPDGRLWVAGDREVQVRSAQGGLLAQLPIEGRATCLAVDEERLYVGVTDHVTVFDAGDLSPIEAWPSLGANTRLTSMTLSDDGLWLADAGNARIGHFDLQGELIGALPPAGDATDSWPSTGHFAVPSPYFDVAVNDAGQVAVANPGWHRVETWTPAGESVGSWGWQSTEPEGFTGCCGPAAIAPLGPGEMVTCDKGLPRVKVYRSDGSLRAMVADESCFAEQERACKGRTQGAIALDVAVDHQGRIVILEPCTGRMRFMAPPTAGDGSRP